MLHKNKIYPQTFNEPKYGAFHFNNKFRVREISTCLTELKSISPLWRPCFGKTVMSLPLYYSLVVLFSCPLFDCHNDYETLIYDIF